MAGRVRPNSASVPISPGSFKNSAQLCPHSFPVRSERLDRMSESGFWWEACMTRPANRNEERLFYENQHQPSDISRVPIGSSELLRPAKHLYSTCRPDGQSEFQRHVSSGGQWHAAVNLPV